MSYAEIADQTDDGQWQRRMVACAVEQAQVFVNDARPEFYRLAQEIIADAGEALAMRWLVSGAPVAGDQDDDQVLLSAVQYAWPIFGATLVPADET